MQTLIQDIRYSLRQLGKHPGSTLTAVISLALGIGATTAVFSVVYAALMNPYPYPTADRIVRLTADSKGGSGYWINLNGPQIRQLRASAGVVESVIAMDYHALTLTGGEVPENVNALGLIANGFSDLGVPPYLGRGIIPADARGRTGSAARGRPVVQVLAEAFLFRSRTSWERRCGSTGRAT